LPLKLPRTLWGVPLKKVLWITAASVGVVGIALSAWLVRPFWRLSANFGDQEARQPSRLYGRPLVISPGDPLSEKALLAELDVAAYFEARAGESFVPGRFRKRPGQNGRVAYDIYLRSFPTARGPIGRVPVTVVFQNAKLVEVWAAGKQAKAIVLEPPLLASYFDDQVIERRPIELIEAPKHLINAVLAAEDSRFFQHSGLSVRGIARAAWVNLRAGAVRQGGSTLTQQLVWNLYLTHERTVSRKLQEAVLAIILELRYEKNDILRAYLNEIYLGRSGGASLVGFGAASRAYFAKEVNDLTLDEAATLAGLIPNPSRYDPRNHPEASKARRDWVLDQMAEIGWAKPDEVAALKAQPTLLAPVTVARRRAAYFADAMRAEAERRFKVSAIAEGGYVLLSTLSLRDQLEADAAVDWGLVEIEKGWQKGRAGGVQSALVSLEPSTGAILAYVGGRDYGESQFDRVSQAARQAGSAFKPVVFATAFEEGLATPATTLEDAPLTVDLPTGPWTPKNDDAEFRGWVTARTAMQQSLNIPTARLAMGVGLPRIVGMAKDLGVSTKLSAVPALSLGAFEVTPIDLATVYATFATGGIRPTPFGLEAVLDPTGVAVQGEPVPEPKRVISPQTAYLVTSILRGVVDHGTAASVRKQGVTDAVAGKTGTTNGRRDSWFAGYTGTRVTLVWVGYDDNSATRLSGARAAVPIWGRFTQRVRRASADPMPSMPSGMTTAVIDPETGELATADCPKTLDEVFVVGTTPSVLCHLHGGFFVPPIEQPDPGVGPTQRPGFRNWLKRMFGREGPAPGPQPPPPTPAPPPPGGRR
jgi:penicillin-binding protein 1B